MQVVFVTSEYFLPLLSVFNLVSEEYLDNLVAKISTSSRFIVKEFLPSPSSKRNFKPIILLLLNRYCNKY